MTDSNILFEKCMKQTLQKSIKGRDIRTYSQSPFAFYCRYFINDSKKDLPREDILSLAKNGLLHEDEIIYDEKQAILSELGIEHENQVSKEYRELIPINFKQIQTSTMKEEFRICMDEMINKKTKILHNAPLFFLPENILGKPDTLEKRKGESLFGSHYYIVKEIKSAKNIKEHDILQAAFYNLLIGKIQRKIPEKFYVINGDKQENEYLFVNHSFRLTEFLRAMRRVLDGYYKPIPIYGDTPYPWSKHGDEISIKKGSITQIVDIKGKRAQILNNKGYDTVNKIASCNVSKLSSIPKIGNRAYEFKRKAQALKHNKIIKKENINFPKRKTEIFLDFESYDFQGPIFLIGLLIRKNRKNQYVSFIAKNKTDEERIWNDFLKFIKKQKDHIVYHWGNFEKTHIKRMAKKYKAPKKILNFLLSEDNIMDIYKISISSFTFPTRDNGLKSIAKEIGFRWTELGVDGGNVGFLFNNYLTHTRKNKQSLQRVLDYNEDDCKATMTIKDWIVKNT